MSGWRAGRLPAALRQAAAPLRAWGWPALAGVLLLLAAWIVDAVVLPRQQAALAATQQQARAERARALAARPAAPPRAPGDAAAQFRAALPPAGSRQQRLAALFDSAARAGLAVRRSEHRYGVEAPLDVARYRVSLPLAGSYAALRSFIQQALAADPALSLDSLRLARGDAGSGTLQAQLQFSLWLQPPGTGPDAASAQLAARGDRR